MASRATLTVLFGFYAVLCCLHPLANKSQMIQSNGLPRLAAAALVPAVLTTLALTVMLLYVHVWALGRANARRGAGAGARFVVARLTDATLLSAVVALLSAAAAAVRLGGGDGVLGLGGADDVGWLG
ncbi:unnamed protein product [Urochloa humidicola]